MYSEDWNDNDYTLEQWAQMEAAGAVFLPVCGHRWGTSVDFGGEYGNTYYWSSMPNSYNNNPAIYVLYFRGDMLNMSQNERYYGLPVRAVRDNNTE